MKCVIFFIPLAAAMAITVMGQTIKTPESRKLADIDYDVSIEQILLSSDKRQLARESKDKTPEHPDITAIQKGIDERSNRIKAWQKEREILASKPESRTLPSHDSHEVLKIIAVQNERIIDLLEKLVRKQN